MANIRKNQTKVPLLSIIGLPDNPVELPSGFRHPNVQDVRRQGHRDEHNGQRGRAVPGGEAYEKLEHLKAIDKSLFDSYNICLPQKGSGRSKTATTPKRKSGDPATSY